MTRVFERLVLDRFEFRGFRGCRCHCGLAILPRPDGRVVVVATECDDNPGTSVTNVAEELATVVVTTFRIDPAKLVWIEHYPPGKIHGKREDWDLASFTVKRDAGGQFLAFDDPVWQPMTPQDWANLGLDPATLFFHPQ